MRSIKILMASAMTALALTACNNRDNGSSSQVDQLRLMAYGHGEPSAVALRSASVTEAIGGSTATTELTVSGTGTQLGVVMNSDQFNTSIVTVQATTGYQYRVDSNTGDVQFAASVYYSEPGCQGTPYVTIGGSINRSLAVGGAVFQLADGTVGMFNPATSVLTNATANSELIDGGLCTPISLSGDIFYPVFPNDPGVSGVPGANVGLVTFGPPA